MKNRRKFVRVVCIVLAGILLLSLISTALMILVNAQSSKEIEQELVELREEQAELEKESDALEEKIAENRSETQTLVERKADIDQSIEMTTEKIRNLNDMVQQYSLLIAEKQTQLEQTIAEEERLNELYKTRLRSMEETGTVSYWSILFGANSFSDLLDKVDMIKEIAESDQLMLEKMKRVAEKISAEREALEQELVNLDQTKKILAQEEEELEVRREEANGLLLEMAQAYESMSEEYEDYLAYEAEISAQIAESETAYFNALAAEEAARIAEQNRKNNNAQSANSGGGGGGGSQPVATSTGSFIYPLPYVCSITDAYGYRIHPLTGKYSWHNGVDFAAAGGTSILAAKSGTVTSAAYDNAWGYYVVINHGDGYSTLYAHMPGHIVSVGDYVTQGQTIGYVGSTGYSTGPHLHFTIYYNGSDVNPMNYV